MGWWKSECDLLFMIFFLIWTEFSQTISNLLSIHLCFMTLLWGLIMSVSATRDSLKRPLRHKVKLAIFLKSIQIHKFDW